MTCKNQFIARLKLLFFLLCETLTSNKNYLWKTKPENSEFSTRSFEKAIRIVSILDVPYISLWYCAKVRYVSSSQCSTRRASSFRRQLPLPRSISDLNHTKSRKKSNSVSYYELIDGSTRVSMHYPLPQQFFYISIAIKH
ncbi:hypothetical protein WUBG_01269 [Wuchereria bancrofti]|uniref:Uncharacterized protein n=1 Tax=Wuchereria bancrofti TaxID=6293 RepID=J9EYY4_WUCBA|nr:hypothetical protein WUBG_01269 [Wuchereria bancrofti]